VSRSELLAFARTGMAVRPPSTPEQVEELVRSFAGLPILSEPVDEATIKEIARQLEREFAVSLGRSHTLANDHRPWLRAKAHSIDFRYWRRYRDFLTQQGFGVNVVNALSDITDNILDLAGDPEAQEDWSRRGLVVGHVQSGKTANYLGLINKAADAGYKLIILIAGIHSNLRSQTQERVDQGFVGRDSDQVLTRQANAARLGVGNLNPSFSAVAFTSRSLDFARNRADGLGIPIHNLSQPAIFVIKKNPSILRNLIEWLGGTTDTAVLQALPMLVIDDEADNASVNTARDPDRPNTINRLIRELLQLSRRNTYIGYTATPFANIFIDPDSASDALGNDLFPRDFIVGLDAPSNYVGAREFFLEDEDTRLTVALEDTESWLPSSHRIETQVEELHHTLIEAIDCFVLSKAIRILRGQGQRHHSMLVNVSRFTRVQGQVAQLISAQLQRMKDAIQNRHASSMEAALRDPLMRSLHETWERRYTDLPEQWKDIQGALHRAAAGMAVVEINAGRNSGALDYRAYADIGLNVIAVGGNSLSRGFTLEGLTISYFLRNTQMYDTLLQMGRWFGYRDGFGDLCRLFIKPQARDWYAFIAEATEELRDEVRRMEAAHLTPEDFGLAVRSHPGTLLVTARNKMRTANEIVREIGLADHLVETTVVHSAEQTRLFNLARARSLVSSLISTCPPPEPVSSRGLIPSQLFRAIPQEPVLEFISAFAIHPANIEMQQGPLLEYIRSRRFSEWDVVVISNSTAPPADQIDIDGMRIGLQFRRVVAQGNGLQVSGDKRRVASRGIERVGLSPDEMRAAEQEHVRAQATQNAGRTIADRFYRHERSRPLLMVHFLVTGSVDGAEGRQHAAYGISFPKLRAGESEQRVAYTANLVAYSQLYGQADADGDEDDETELE
jgi:hypothetical protein